jgi:hypothetical protein
MGHWTNVFALDQKVGQRMPHLMPPPSACQARTNRGKHSGIKRRPAPGLTYLNGLPVKSVHINMRGGTVGMTLFDYVAIGVLIALALWASVLLYLRRKM